MIQFTEELRRFCVERGVSATGLEAIQSIVTSDPARSPVTSSLSPNIPVDFSSTKNGVMIATESMLEYANALDHEISPNSKLALNQPKYNLPIKYKSNNRFTVANPTFDFFVISESFIGFEEVKLSKQLEKLSKKAPCRFYWDDEGQAWASPVIEERLRGTGLGFRYVTERKFTQFMLDNYNFLLGYLSSEPHYSYCNDVKIIKSALKQKKSIEIKVLARELKSIESIYRLICLGGVFFPIRDVSLLNDKVLLRKIYLDESTYLATQSRFEIDLETDFEQLPYSKQVDLLRKAGALADVDQGMSVAEAANLHNISRSTLYGWMQVRREYGMSGLIHNKDKCGNYEKRYGNDVFEYAIEKLSNELRKSEAVVVADAISTVYDLIVEKFSIAVSERTLYKYANTILPNVQRDRHGAKVASKSTRFSSKKKAEDLGIFDGGFFLARCHIDHTQIDLEVVNEDGVELGRPWLTTIVDEDSNKILACYLSFKKPSYVTAMMAIRLMVFNHGYFPAAFVTDGGREFSSRSFKYLAACHKSSVIDRTGKPWVATIERLFGVFNTMVFNNLKGNTKIMKDIRSVSATHNPKRLAYYTLGEAYELIDGASNSINKNIPIRAGKTANQLQEISIEKHGLPSVRVVEYNTKFIMESLPFIKGRKTVSLAREKYVSYDNKKYWHTILRMVPKRGTSVVCKYDPWNPNHIYPSYNDTWLEFNCSKRVSIPVNPNELKIFGELSSRELSLNLSAKPEGKRKVRRDMREAKKRIEQTRLENPIKPDLEDESEAFVSRQQNTNVSVFDPSLIFDSEIVEDGAS